MRFHLTFAILTLFLHDAKMVRLELLLMEKRDWPAESTITELSILERAPEILNLTDGRSVYWWALSRVVLTRPGCDMSV